MNEQTDRIRSIAWWVASFFSFVASGFMFLNDMNKAFPLGVDDFWVCVYDVRVPVS